MTAPERCDECGALVPTIGSLVDPAHEPSCSLHPANVVTMTSVRPLGGREDAQAVTGLGFTHRPGEWDGTYGIILRALFTDLLDDGTPITDVRVTYEGDDGALMLAEGTVTALVGGSLIFADNVTVDTIDVVAVSIN